MKKFKKVAKSLVVSLQKSRSKSRNRQAENKPRSTSRNRQPNERTRSKSRSRTSLNVSKSAEYSSPIKEPLKPDYTERLEDYDPDEEPDFWRPFFKPKEMLEIRDKIQRMIIDDIDPTHGYKRNWSVCNLTKQFLRTYHVPAQSEIGRQPNGAYGPQHEPYFVINNVLLCAMLVIFGIISNRMIGQEYEFALKGGKAVQIVLDSTPNAPEYKSEDIDVLVIPKKAYDAEEIKRVAGHLANLFLWFLHMPDRGAIISVQTHGPRNPRANPFIYKLSYGSKYGDRLAYKAMMDIDFKEIPDEIRTLYSNPYLKTVGLRKFKTDVTFLCPNIGSLLDEKVFYYVKYFKYLKRIQAGERVMEDYNGVQTEVTEKMCDFMIGKVNVNGRPNETGKFDKAIRALTIGLEKKRGDNTVEAYRASVKRRLDKVDQGRPRFDLSEAHKREIIQTLFP